MRVTESILRGVIRRVILESERKEGLGERLLLNYGDIVELKMNMYANSWILVSNPGIDMMSSVGLDYKVQSVYVKDGDESEDPIVFCDLLYVSDGEVIKDVPCYSDVLSVVENMEQCSDLREGDRVILKDITLSDYNIYRGKVDLQSLLGSIFKIERISKDGMHDFHGKLIWDTRYAIISPDGEEYIGGSKVLFVVPLVDEFVKKFEE